MYNMLVLNKIAQRGCYVQFTHVEKLIIFEVQKIKNLVKITLEKVDIWIPGEI